MQRQCLIALLPVLATCSVPAPDVTVPGVHLEPRASTRPLSSGCYHASIRGRWVDAEGKPHAGARAVLLAGHGRVLVASTACDANGAFRFDDVSADGAVYVWGSAAGDGRDTGWLVPRCDGGEVDLGDLRMDADTDPDAGAPMRSVRGTVTARDGTPIGGATMILFGAEDGFDPGALATTDSQGRFQLTAWLRAADYLEVDTGTGGSFGIRDVTGRAFGPVRSEDGAKDSRWGEADLWQPLRIVLPETATIRLTARGVERVQWSRATRGSWWPLPAATDEVLSGERVRYRAEAPGWLPRFVEVPAAAGDAAVDFDRATSARFRLAVTDDAGPVPLARVLLGSAGQKAELQTGPDGRLDLLGAADRSWNLVVTAKDHLARCATWSADAPLSVRLPRLDARLLVPHLGAGEDLSVFVPGAAQPSALLRGPAQNEDLAVPAGALEAVLTREFGSDPLRSVAFRVAAGATATLPDGDQRGRIELQFPAGAGWRVSVDRQLPSVTHEVPLCISSWDPAATVRRLDDTHFELAITRSGRMVVLAGRPDMNGCLLREGDVPLTAHERWQAAPLDAQVAGSCRSIDLTVPYHHGFSRPRLLLRSRAGPWDRLVAFPTPTAAGQYRIDDVAAGDHVVFAHLAAQPGWGGIALCVGRGGGVLADFAHLPRAALPVRVVDAAGAPITAAELRVRDPMYECWENVLGTGSSGAAAAFPLPEPPSCRLDASGRGTLPSIRRGWLELQVALDDGRTFAATAEVDPPSELQLRLPAR